MIALGYVLSLVAGCGAVTVNELLMPSDISQGSPGMVAFGDKILFVLVAGFVGMVPTLFLLRLAIDKAPRASLAVLAVVVLAGLLSWLTMQLLAGGAPAGPPSGLSSGCRPAHCLRRHTQDRRRPGRRGGRGAGDDLRPAVSMRAVLAAAMLMDLVPMGIDASRMASAMLR